jgi:hypothetical protein
MCNNIKDAHSQEEIKKKEKKKTKTHYGGETLATTILKSPAKR